MRKGELKFNIGILLMVPLIGVLVALTFPYIFRVLDSHGVVSSAETPQSSNRVHDQGATLFDSTLARADSTAVQFIYGDFFHSDGSMNIDDHDVLWCAFSRGNVFFLDNVSVRISPEYDPILDDSDTIPTGRRISISQSDSVLFCIKGIPGLRPGKIHLLSQNRQLLSTWNLPKEGSEQELALFDFGGRSFEMFADTSSLHNGRSFSVVLAFMGQTRVLCSESNVVDAIARLEWVADLNGDQYPDFLLSTSGHYSNANYRLFLSYLRNGQVQFDQVGFDSGGC